MSFPILSTLTIRSVFSLAAPQGINDLMSAKERCQESRKTCYSRRKMRDYTVEMRVKRDAKPVIVLANVALLLSCVLCQTIRAQSTIESGTVTLADEAGANTGPGALTVQYSVTESLSNVYTYSYIIGNPSADVGTGATFSVGFNSTVAGALLGSPSGDGVDNSGLGGRWQPIIITPGNSATLSFESDDAPTMGNANANGGTPGPWSSSPDGSQIPVPTVVPEPESSMTMLAGLLLVFPLRSIVLKKASIRRIKRMRAGSIG